MPNVGKVSGDPLPDIALNEAISTIEDMELTGKTIVMRVWHFNDLCARGVSKNCGASGILLISAMPLYKILHIPAKHRSHGWRRLGFSWSRRA